MMSRTQNLRLHCQPGRQDAYDGQIERAGVAMQPHQGPRLTRGLDCSFICSTYTIKREPVLTSPQIEPHPHRLHWDTRYRDAYQERPPSPLLLRWSQRLVPGRALDVACGAGRHALLLAAQGWRVLGLDISPIALRIAQQSALQRDLAVELVAVDLSTWPLPVGYFDLICVFRFLDRRLCPQLASALRPGGTLIYETFTVAQRACEGGPRTDALLLQLGELPTLFPTLEQLEYVEGIVEEDGRPRALAGLVARRGGGTRD